MKTVIVTGASRGIGAAAAEYFAVNGYNTVINYNKNKKQAELLAEKIINRGGNAAAVYADVSEYEDVYAMVQKTLDLFGNIDVLVNNAGIAQQKLFTDISDNDFDNMFSVNVKGVFNCCKCVLPYMIEKRQGKIINVSSMWGITGASCEVHYSASKAAVIGLTKALAKEAGLSGIQVNAVAPGTVKTDMCAEFSKETLDALAGETALGRIGTSEDIAKVIYFLASPQADYITGQVISADGGMVI